MKIVHCDYCESSFKVKPSKAKTAKFCSLRCKWKDASLSQKGRAMPEGCRFEKHGLHTRCAPAKICGHITKKGRSYCKKCRKDSYSEVHYINCAECNKLMRLSSSEKEKYKCCSYSCRNKQISKRQTGVKSHLWRGGLTSKDRLLRNSADYDNWRKSVFKRDDYTCQICGIRGGKITADHIKEWFLYPDLRFDVSNGRTLCVPCHKETDNFGGKAYAKMVKLSKNGALQYRLL